MKSVAVCRRDVTPAKYLVDRYVDYFSLSSHLKPIQVLDSSATRMRARVKSTLDSPQCEVPESQCEINTQKSIQRQSLQLEDDAPTMLLAH